MTSENFEFKVLARDGAARQGEIPRRAAWCVRLPSCQLAQPEPSRPCIWIR